MHTNETPEMKKKEKENERRMMKKAEMLKWKYKFSVHPNHCEWEIVHSANLLLLLLFIEVQHLSASRWFPISLFHNQPVWASTRSYYAIFRLSRRTFCVCVYAGFCLAFYIFVEILLELLPSHWQNALMMQQQRAIIAHDDSDSSPIRRNVTFKQQI